MDFFLVFHRFLFNVLNLQWKSVKRGSVGIKPLLIYLVSESDLTASRAQFVRLEPGSPAVGPVGCNSQTL